MKNKHINLIITILFLIGIIGTMQGQTDKELLAELAAEEQEAINALVLYPADTRRVILETTLHPEALIKIESIQNRSSEAFREMMESIPQNSQQVIWDLSRYPGLIHELAKRRTGSEKTMEEVLKDYPAVIHKRAEEAAANHDMPLVAVDVLNQSAESAFQAILDDYPAPVQANLRELIDLPEVLSILTENIRLTLLVGHVYKKEPDWMMQQADSLNLEVARQNAQEIEDWKKNLKDDPEAMAELRASVHTYNQEYGYDDAYYDYETEEVDFDEPRTEVIVRQHYYYNYPYWFGYPYWYTYPRWQYYPSWYDWGFYAYPNHPVVIIGMPSFHFTYWFFDHPNHHRHYSHLSAHFVNHYHGHRRSGNSITTSVNRWRNSNREVISDKWMKNDGRLSNRFKEYGEFESSRENYNKKHPKEFVSQKDYIKRNEKKYPTVSKSSRDQQLINKDIRVVNRKDKNPKQVKPPVKKRSDKVSKPKADKPVKRNPTTIKNPRTKQQPEIKKAPKVNKAKDYHKNKWETTKTTRTKTQSDTRSTTKKKISPKKKPVRTKKKSPQRKSGGEK